MFVFAIQTKRKTVAFLKTSTRERLDDFLVGKSACGMHFRGEVDGWDGVAPFTARLATAREEYDYYLTHANMHHAGSNGRDCDPNDLESFWYHAPLSGPVTYAP